jgi:hypothetical protein
VTVIDLSLMLDPSDTTAFATSLTFAAKGLSRHANADYGCS